MWAILPIMLKSLVNTMDGYTISWYRLVVSAPLLVIYIVYRRKYSPLRKLKLVIYVSLLFAAIMLTFNWVTYVLSLNYLSPSTATVVIQLAPVFMLFGSIWIFKEHFSVSQWLGFVVLMIGLYLFFNDRFNDLLTLTINGYLLGVILVIVAALLWALYALVQKQLLRYFTSEEIMAFIYICGIITLLPLSKPDSIIHLDKVGMILLILCGLNTLLAYGFFAESLNHWEASRISMVLATIPIITIIFVKWSSMLFPDYIEAGHFNVLSIFGAVLVVVGSMVCSLSKSNN
jgi:drug/metabolite transporter (DMT)-like permease